MYHKAGGVNQKEKYAASYLTIKRYLYLKCKGWSIADFFINNQYYNIALYGIGDLGEIIFWDLKNSKINLKYIIDKKADEFFTEFNGIKVVPLEKINKEDKVDIILITNILKYNEILDNLEKVNVDINKILHINQVIFGGVQEL